LHDYVLDFFVTLALGVAGTKLWDIDLKQFGDRRFGSIAVRAVTQGAGLGKGFLPGIRVALLGHDDLGAHQENNSN
jgi:hypothetical protein